MVNKKQNDCVGHINEDWYKADKYITYAHKVTARAYWVFIIFVIAIACNIVGLFNHHFSTRSHISKYEDMVELWCKFMNNEDLYIYGFKPYNENNEKYTFYYSKEPKNQTDSIKIDSIINELRDTDSLFIPINCKKIIFEDKKLLCKTDSSYKLIDYKKNIIKDIELLSKIDSSFKTIDYKKFIIKDIELLCKTDSLFELINFKRFIITDINFSDTSCSIFCKKRKIDNYKPEPINPRLTTYTQKQEFANQNLKLWYISIPILGIHISAEDFFLIMSFTFMLLSWFLKHTIKAENLTVGKILTMFNKKPIELKELIFYGIVFNNLFFPTTQRKKPYKELTEREKTLTAIVESMRDKSSPEFKNYLIGMFWVPTVMCIINLGMYIASVWCYNEAGAHCWFFTIVFIFGVIFTAFVVWANIITIKYQKGTNKILYNFKRCLKHDYDIIKNIKDADFVKKEKEIIVVKVNSDVIYNDKYSNRKEEFCKKYENEYILLTHTGDSEELKRILKFIKEDKGAFGTDCKEPVKKENINKKFIENIDEDFINFGKSKNIENFIFIKT